METQTKGMRLTKKVLGNEPKLSRPLTTYDIVTRMFSDLILEQYHCTLLIFYV
jgi:hypothetical protein